MRKYVLLAFAVVVVAACQKIELPDDYVDDDGMAYKLTRFNFDGDFGNDVFTRGSMSADGRDMTDLWVFDYVDDDLVQMVHQSSDDDDFGEPELFLAYGAHHLYFVASRGVNPSVDDVDHVITWTSVRDTFWGDYTLTVSESSAVDHDVELGRVVARLKVLLDDVIPSGLSSITVTPETWYYGLDYIDGSMVQDENDVPVTVSVPSSYIGTSGTVYVSIFTISDATEWTTDFTVTARKSDNSVMGTVAVTNAPLKANRTTGYSGRLLSAPKSFGLTLDDGWLNDVVMTW
jgi:hypothetical protein